MSDRTETADVVVGCGPGGATLAYLLARSSVDVALVERAATFEREFRGFGWTVPRSGPLRRRVEPLALGDRSISVARSHFTD